MSFLPVENFIIHSPLSVGAAIQKITANIGQADNGGIGSSFTQSKTQSNLYEGVVYGQEFKINRVIGYRNSFLPIIKGKIEMGPGGTDVHIKMRASIAVILFMSIWLGLTGLSSLVMIMLMITSKSVSVPLLLPIFMFIFGSLLFSFAFKFESRLSKAFLNELFEVKTPGNEWLNMSR